MNKMSHNVLDAALNADRKNVLLAIASHERLVKDPKEEEHYKVELTTLVYFFFNFLIIFSLCFTDGAKC